MRKVFWRRIVVGISVLVIVASACLSAGMVSASYVSDNSTNAQQLEQVRILYEAALRCMGSTERQSTTISLSSRSAFNNDYMKNFYNLNRDKIFDDGKGSGSSNLVYSATLESQASSGYKDGKIYCSELNLLPDLLAKLGKYTTEVRDSLICNGSQPGIFSVTTGYGGQMFGAKYDNDDDGKKDWPVGWPAQDDCSGNLKLLIDYVENRPNEAILGSGNGNYDYPFNVKLTPSANAASHFQSVVGPLVGDFSSLSSETQDTMDYWRYYQAFETGCGVKVNNGNTTPPAASSTNMNAIYDAVTKKVYYHSDSEIHSSNKIYYNVKDSSQLTCKELATKLGENAADIALQTQYADVQDCIARYKDALDQLEGQITKYKSVQIYASGFKNYLKDKITQIRNGKFEMTPGGSWGAPQPFDLKKAVQESVKGFYYNNIHAGVDGKIIYNDSLLNTMVSAFEDIANNVMMAANQVDIESKPNDETLENFDKLLDQWQTELDRVESEIKSAQNLLDEKRKLVGGSDDDSRGEVWEFDDSTLMVTCPGLDKLKDEISGVLSAAPPNIDTDWSGITPDDPDYSFAGSGADADACTGAAGSLGWILCPVLKMVSAGVDDIYEGYVQKQFLEIDASKVSDGSAVYVAWQSIRDLANILFVAFFLFVLFSQLTGIGLSNYGVKKMLPKLIVVAVLVNVSFLLCQFAVDLSNVVGYSVNRLFDQMSGTINDLNFPFNDRTGGTGVLMSWVSVLGIAVGLGTMGSWLPMLLLVLLSSAISVFFGALILGARQAGIFVLIVLSPVAIVCYALPNAKKMFDRWLKMFTSLLVVFPICGALMGGGYFASTILMETSDSFFLTLVAMLLRVVPFFMIPSLLRSSMAAMGNIGTKLAGVGNRLGGNITNATRKSDGFQRFSEFGEQVRGRGISLRHKALSKLTGGKYTGSRGSKRRLARAISTQEARIRGDAKAAAIAGGGFISSGRAKDIMASAEDAEETQGIKDAENAYKLRTDMDAGDAKAMSKELERRLNELEQNPENIEVRRKVKALTKILLESDDGRGALMEVTQQHAATHTQAHLDANGNIDGYNSSEATKILGKYLGNGENMGKIKGNNQRGLQNLVKDINGGNAIQTTNAYNAMGANKISANAVGGMDTTALAAQVRAAQSGDLSGESLRKLAETYTRALTSENAANDIPDELVGDLNAIREAAYNEKMQTWLNSNTGKTAADYAAKFGAFSSLDPGDELRIQHVKAAVPTGFTEAGIWIGGGNGPTRQQQIAYDEWARHSAEIDRQNSQQQQP